MHVKSHRTKPEQGEETKSQLVAAGRELFASRGFAEVALAEVSALAGVTRGALYHHFPGKEGLFRAVCEQVAGELTERVIVAGAGEPDAWLRLQTGCRTFLDACADPAIQQILLADAPSVLGWGVLREIDERHGLGLLRLALQEAMDQGVVAPGPVDTFAHVLVGALNEAAMLIGRAEDPTSARDDAVVAIDRLLAGIAVVPGEHSRASVE